MLKRVVPKTLNWVALGLVALVALHLVTIAIILMAQPTIKEGIKQANPALTEQELSYALTVALLASILFHSLFVLLYSWLAFQIRTGSQWSRVTLTVVLIVATIASAVSFFSSPLFRLLIPFGDVLQLALIGLLWVPASSRAFFAARNSSST